MENTFPEKIRAIINNKKYVENTSGKTDSRVYVFDDMVLKVQRKSEEVLNEINIMRNMENILPLPKLIQYEEQEDDDRAYVLMTRIEGKMIADCLYDSQLIDMICDAFKILWSIDITQYSVSHVSNINKRLESARYNVQNNLVDVNNVMSDTYGKYGFLSPEALLEWLENNIPPLDLVFTHGDFCFENIFVNNNQISGFIDLGKAGIADRWQDLAICIRELDDVDPRFSNELLEKLGIVKDDIKLRYYMLLDELF